MAQFRIISIDGGGIRGVFTAVLLKRIHDQIPDLIGITDLFAGTSSGGILALGLAYGIAPVEAIVLYQTYGQQVFDDDFLDDLKDLGQIVGAQYDIYNLQEVLTPFFGAATLYDLLARKGKYVLVPTFDLDAVKDGVRTWKPKFFHNFPGPDSDDGELIVDVLMRSSAAPTYFQSYQGYIDGGVVVNNPSMAALAQALDTESGGQKREDIRLLSFGTGYFPRFIGGNLHNWGLGQWSWPLVSIMMEGGMGVSDYQCQSILGANNYHRLAPTIEEAISLDDIDKIPDLIAAAEEVDISETVDWVRQHFV